MGLNEVPSGERRHIAIFGRRNAGKSSLMNAITGQDLSVVSKIGGTTTDPVHKAMELLPLGPVVLIDTPGLDDEGELGEKRVKKSRRILDKADMAILVIDAEFFAKDGGQKQLLRKELPQLEMDWKKTLQKHGISFLIVVNKSETLDDTARKRIIGLFEPEEKVCFASAKTGEGIPQLREGLAELVPSAAGETECRLVGDLLGTGDYVVLVVPIDSSAPKGRLILPQQQVIRDALEAGAIPVVTREKELEKVLSGLREKPKMVITDSQAFKQVAKEVPEDIPLTSFSILFSRYKGELETQVSGARSIDHLRDGDRVLIAEGCTHHRQCEDIGTVKLPRFLLAYTKKTLKYEFCSGSEFPEDLAKYALVIHCGACTLNAREMKNRVKRAKSQSVPITNYGVAIAYMHGILERSIDCV